MCKEEQLYEFLKALDVPETLHYSLIKTCIKQRVITLKNGYCSSASYKGDYNLDSIRVKIAWYLISKCKDYPIYNCNPKHPALIYLFRPLTADESKEMSSDLTVFYIQKGSEDNATRIIETCYGNMKSTVKTVLIVDDFEQCNNISLSKIFQVVDVVKILPNGKVASILKQK